MIPTPPLPAHHPPSEWLFAHAAGTLTEVKHLLVAAHNTLCPTCRAEVRMQEAAAGAAFAGLSPAKVAPGSLDALLTRLGPQEPLRTSASRTGESREIAAPTATPNLPRSTLLPRPLAAYTGPFEQIQWRQMVPGVRVFELPLRFGTLPLRLFDFAAGLDISHAHRGIEHSLVLSGSYTDQDGTFARGDVDTKDTSSPHLQHIDDGANCIALVCAERAEVPLSA